MKDFRSLKVWEKSYLLTLAVYKATEQFPKQELYALTNQIQRSAVSIPANIAEGCGKDSEAELKRYFLLLWGQPVNWNACFYWRATSVISRLVVINLYKAIW